MVKDYMHVTWEKLIHKAQKGNQTAITELYNRTYSQGFSVALQMVKNEEDAMDILQNAYISAFNNLHTIREPEKFKNWFNCIVANKCRDFLRKHKDIVFSEMEGEEDVSYEETLESDLIEFSPEQSVDYSETKKLINDILQELPQEQRLCILMYYYNELSVKEIAEALECSENTVKSRLNYARKKIKEDIKALEKKGIKLRGFAGFTLLSLIKYLLETEHVSVPPISKKVFAGSAKTVTKHTIKHLGVKIVSSMIAVTISTIVIAGIVNPKVLYPIDVFNIVEEAPIKVLERFEDGFNEGDIDKMLGCLEPDVQKEIKGGQYVADGFLEEFFATNTDGVFSIVTSFGQCNIVADKNNSRIDLDSAKITADINIDFLSLKDTMRATVYMKKIDGRWYITDERD